MVSKYGVENLVVDTMSVVNLGLTLGAVETADKLLVPLTREREGG